MNARDAIVSTSLGIGLLLVVLLAFSPASHPANPNLMDLARRFLVFGAAWPMILG